MSPLALAYLGDALMSVKAREYVLSQGITKPQEFQKATIRFVSAKAQASFLAVMLSEEFLNEDELLVFKRGRNARSLTIPKNTDMMTYKLSTGFEALWGYLYLDNQLERIEELWQFILKVRESQ